MSKSLSFYNLTGGLNTVQDLATINSTGNRTESPDMMNIEYYKLGGIQTMKGNTLIGECITEDTQTEWKDVKLGYEYTIGNQSYMVCVNAQGEVFEYNPTTKLLEPLLDADDEPVVFDRTGTGDEWEGRTTEPLTEPFSYTACSYNNGVVISNGYELLYYRKDLDAEENVIQFYVPKLITTETVDTTQTTITTYISPVCVASYKGRLFVGSNKVTQVDSDDTTTNYDYGMLFYSGVGLGTQENWNEGTDAGGDDAGAFAEFFEDSSDFVALGNWAEYLVIHKKQNTYILDGEGSLSSDWQLKTYSEYTVPSAQGFVVANNCYYTYVPEAHSIHPLFTRSIYNNLYQGGDLSYKIKDTLDFIDSTKLDEVYATYNPEKKYILFYLPMIDNLGKDGEYNGSGKCYIYDILTKTWLFRQVPQYVTTAFKYDNITYIGTKDGKVLREFYGKTFDGEPIEFYWLSPSFIWGGGTNKTTTKEFRVKMLNTSTNHFYVESFKDGNLAQKKQRLIKNTGDNLNGLMWDIGLNLDDRNLANSYNPINLYEYSNSANYYYSEDYPLTSNSKIYQNIVEVNGYNPNTETWQNRYMLDGNYVYYPYLYGERTQSTASDYDYVTYTPNNAYCWNKQEASELCYRYVDGDKTYYAWVGSGSKCKTNLTTEDATTSYGYMATIIGGVNGTGYSLAFKVDNPSWLTDGTEHLCYATAPVNNPNQVVNSNYYENGAKVLNGYVAGFMVYLKPSSVIYHPYQYTVVYRREDWDTVQHNAKEVPEGDVPLNITKAYTVISANSKISIQVKNGNSYDTIELTRYSAGDLNVIDNTGATYYTKTQTPTTSTVAYLRSDFSGNTASITAVSGNTITISGNTYTRYPQGDVDQSIPTYWKNNHINLTYDSTLDGWKYVYEYPDADSPLWNLTLTDTIWDYSDLNDDLPEGYDSYDEIPVKERGEAWLLEGYQTKRFLLPDQYFETVQFKFSGGGYDEDGNERLNDNICISGFEVDGIQLAETPWS